MALEYLWDVAAPRTTGEIADAVAAVEAGTDPAPRGVRESVATSLRQTHLPTLETHGLVTTGDAGISATPAAKRVVRRIRDTGPLGLRWSEQYRLVGLVGLCSVVAVLAGVPFLAALDPLVPAVLSLVAYAALSGYHTWTLYPRSTRSPRRRGALDDEWRPTQG
ncbi:DUF7344 domain-containing protein [Halolamina litorea]|uniref:DUF7344 domain-containing protein n=1 Tax=Halolamina litorea TaxID=1515593 RepID=A0ABD6BT65_9EURY|nr:hypothetical protein [Halolamina litorea]